MALQKEIAMYAICQREQFGFDKAVETAKAAMARYSVAPNMLVVTPQESAAAAPPAARAPASQGPLAESANLLAPQISLYMNVGSNERIKYDTYGPKGPNQFDAGVSGFEASTFRGCGVFTSAPFNSGDDSDAVQMLQRSTQVGEYYRARAPSVWDSTPGTDGKKKKLPSSYMDLKIYDEERDNLVHITFRQMLEAAVFEGMTGDIFQLKDTDYDFDSTAAKPNPHDALRKNARDKWTLEDVQAIATSVEAGTWHPISIVVARPFIEHLMMSAVLTVAGRDTGATLYGPAGKLHPHHPFPQTSTRTLTFPLPSFGARRHAGLRQHVGEDHRGVRSVPNPCQPLPTAARARGRETQNLWFTI